MFMNLAQRILGLGASLSSTRQRVLAGALIVAAVTVACGTDSSPAAGGGTPQDEPTTPSATATAITAAGGNGSGGQPTVPGQVVKSSKASPSFEVETFAHGTYNLDETVGRPVLINFWFPSCPPCRAELPDLQAAYEEYGDEIDFLGVQQTSLDTKSEGIEFLGELGITYPNFADETDNSSSQIQIAYQVLSFPTTVFLNPDHSVSRTWSGLINEKNLREQIEKAIGG